MGIGYDGMKGELGDKGSPGRPGKDCDYPEAKERPGVAVGPQGPVGDKGQKVWLILFEALQVFNH